jgi:CRP-like cAMP-binding protein
MAVLLSYKQQVPAGVDAMRGVSPAVDTLCRLSSYGSGERIYREADPADRWYCIVSGAAREAALLADGRRRIVDFLLPGDFFGLSAPYRQDYAAEAVVAGTTIASYPRRSVETAAESDPRLCRQIQQIAYEAISRSQTRLLVLGRVTARAKLGSFILDMARRAGDGDTVTLPMSRYDIADYLALSVETVSRALTELRRRGAIRLLNTHRILILDHQGLESDAGAGRRAATPRANRDRRERLVSPRRHRRPRRDGDDGPDDVAIPAPYVHKEHRAES